MEPSEFITATSRDEATTLDVRFERMFRAYQQPIASYLLRLVDDHHQAEELTQDVFLKAYRALGSLPLDANERAWLYRIATNTAYDALRRRRLIQWLPLKPRRASPSRDHGLEQQVVEQDAVREALDQLSPTYRIPLVLYTVEGFSTREIAEVLDISVSAVKVRIYRARQKFQEAYEESGR